MMRGSEGPDQDDHLHYLDDESKKTKGQKYKDQKGSFLFMTMIVIISIMIVMLNIRSQTHSKTDY